LVKRFDIVKNLDTASREAYPYLIILQHDRAETVATIVTAPLAPSTGKRGTPRLHPRIELDGLQYVIFVAQLAAIPKNQLGRAIATAEASEYEITAALDMLFTGI
jgi:toxin CcdB